MASASGDIRRPAADPFDYHVYVGFSAKNSEIVQRMIKTLDSRLNLKCCSRADIPSPSKEEFDRYIGNSEKCILFVTPEYMEDTWSQQEATIAAQKAGCFSQDMLLVLKNPHVSLGNLRNLGLEGFRPILWDTVPLPNSNDVAIVPEAVCAWLLQEVALCPIVQLPEKISGYAEAFVYYYGYLTWILGDHRGHMNKAVGLLEGVDNPGTHFVLPMIIVVPQSCCAPKSFDVEGKITTLEHGYVIKPCDQGGQKKRDYKRSVMRLIDSSTDEEFYFSGEFPACLITLRETCESGLAGVSMQQLINMRTDFFQTLQSLLCHPDNRHCIDQYRLVLWPDDGDETVDLHSFLLPILRKTAGESDASSLVVFSPTDAHNRHPDSGSFSPVDSGGSLLNMWGRSRTKQYAMRDISPRGICLIVSISGDPVPGSKDADVQQLRQLFGEQFNFEVRVHSQQLTFEQLEELLTDLSVEDHGPFDAFVCYVSSRGGRGRVNTSDGRYKRVVELMDIFNTKNCPGLLDKPKLFLVEMTDDGTSIDLMSEVGRNLPETPPSSSSSSQGPVMSDAAGLMSPTDDGESLVPREADFILTYACKPASECRGAGEVSVYVRALVDYLRPGEDVDDALRKATEQFKKLSPGGEAQVVHTASKRVVFPC